MASPKNEFIINYKRWDINDFPSSVSGIQSTAYSCFIISQLQKVRIIESKNTCYKVSPFKIKLKGLVGVFSYSFPRRQDSAI
ncbi:hypothetical protein L2E82_13161 [Cichorium intybus]|uniref:Uncharacterized protein n=1 Tax=Cichorium intybus TaxID=13427 RepID=A0ACB9GHJ2_CICIN|nr:hypothetical protein L2E82_13161 [Cichorium intybus]